MIELIADNAGEEQRPTDMQRVRAYWEDAGFASELACVAASLQLEIDRLERKLDRLQRKLKK